MKHIHLFEGFLNEAKRWTDQELADEAAKYTTIKDFRGQSSGAYQVAHLRGIISQITAHMERGTWSEEELAQDAAKYATLKDFREQSSSAYQIARNRGKDFFNRITSRMERGKGENWTDDGLAQEAAKYTTLKDFREQSSGAYQVALRRGKDFFNRITAHMERGTWSEEELAQEAAKYTTLKDFREQSPNAYDIAIKHRGKDFFNRITSHMERGSWTSWTDDRLAQEADKYVSLKDFREQSHNAYQIALRRGKDFFNRITSRMERGKGENWTDDGLAQEAAKYTTLKDFREQSSGAYETARNRGKDFFNRITSHLERGSWTDEELRQEALKYRALKDFITQSYGAYQAARLRGILSQITAHMERGTWSEEELAQEASKYNSTKDFREQSINAYHAARSRGILSQITAHMERGTWSEEELAQDAAKYVSLKDFREQSSGAYETARNRGKDFFNRITAHMERGKRENWTEEELALKQEAAKYTTLEDFKEQNPVAYKAAYKKGILNRITPHIKKY